MLEVLCGSKNIQKILLFLFVNGKCYGNQLARALHTPLTPVQKALNRLEKGGLIMSYYEGKTRLYQFNPGYPLLNELEILLKKAYTLLSPPDKKLYCFVREVRKNPRQHHKPLHLMIWERLSCVQEISFHARTKSKEGGWNGKGTGEVTVTKDGDNVLIFTEKGSWKDANNQETDFSNTFRWTLDRISGMISLEHLRRGWNHPVFLFHLVPSGNHSLASMDPHLCHGDAYFGQLICDRHCLRLSWRVIGEKKNEEMDYYYS